MQGKVGVLSESAYIPAFIKKHLSKEHPVLACVFVTAAFAGGGACVLGLW